jgi:hypothetical protein
VLCLAPAAIVHPDYGVTYSGGSLQTVKGGQSLRLVLTPDTVLLYRDKAHGEPELRLPTSAITEINYSQEAHRRVGAAIATSVLVPRLGWMLLMSQTKKHYIGLTWNSQETSGGMVLQVDKDAFRGLLAALEGMTARKANNLDMSEGQTTTVRQPDNSGDQGTPPQPAPQPNLTPVSNSFALLSVLVQSNPADALVDVDGYPAGRTPVDVKLQRGEYTLHVTKTGYQPWTQKLVVEPGKAQSVGVALAATVKAVVK